MKKISLIIFILLWSSLSHAGGFVFDGPTTAGSALTCKVSPGTETGGGWVNTTNDHWWNPTSAITQNYQYVQNGATVEICKISQNLLSPNATYTMTVKVCDTDCSTNCSDTQTVTINGTINNYAFYDYPEFATHVTKTGDFAVCVSGSSGTIKMATSTATTYFGTNTAGKNFYSALSDRGQDANLKIWYMQP